MINREDKIIVEEQQGSATMVEPKNIGRKPSNGKKLYLESYGCQMNF